MHTQVAIRDPATTNSHESQKEQQIKYINQMAPTNGWNPFKYSIFTDWRHIRQMGVIVGVRARERELLTSLSKRGLMLHVFTPGTGLNSPACGFRLRVLSPLFLLPLSLSKHLLLIWFQIVSDVWERKGKQQSLLIGGHPGWGINRYLGSRELVHWRPLGGFLSLPLEELFGLSSFCFLRISVAVRHLYADVWTFLMKGLHWSWIRGVIVYAASVCEILFGWGHLLNEST